MKAIWFIAGIAVVATIAFVTHSKTENLLPEKSSTRTHARPEKSVSSPPDHFRNTKRLFAEKEWKRLNDAVDAWFEADPAAAREWIASLENLEPLEPAIARIAAGIGRKGDAPLALQWAELLPPGPAKNQSVHDIYALAARNHQLTDDELRAAQLPPEEIERLLSRTADD